MAIKRKFANINVLEAAKIRIKNVFANGLPVYMSFSGGKDSLCLADVTMRLIQSGEIDASLLVVQFIDEEAIYKCIEDKVKEWRKKFLMVDAKFEWYCLQVRHFNCFNALENDESFICWDERKKEQWIRIPPTFAITKHPLLRERIDSYQEFLDKKCADGMCMVGIRTAESLQRLQSFSRIMFKGKGSAGRTKIYPIYDWKNSDVWKYLLDRNIDIPEIYMNMWQAGMSKNQMRVSQFFSVDTARSLVRMNEFYPDLMEHIIRREPNAYLASLYWDSEMFGRNGRARSESEGTDTVKDYRKELNHMFSHFDQYFDTPHKRKIAKRYRNFYVTVMNIANDKEMKKLYESLIAGDPKLRNLRALYQNVYSRYIQEAKKGRLN